MPSPSAAPASNTDQSPQQHRPVDLSDHGLINTGTVHANLPTAALVELVLKRGEALLTDQGAVSAYTGERTGRSPQDRFLVEEPSVQNAIWWGPINRPMHPDVFHRLYDRVCAYLQGRDLFCNDGWACADPRYRLPVRVIAEHAWHALFARSLLLRPAPEELAGFEPRLTILVAGNMQADPERDGTRTGTFIVLNLDRGLVLIGGTYYAGEIKKAVFAVLNYLLPGLGVFPMHCSANVGSAGDTALFFGLSGTGKTTLSADPERRLIGDDEHGWSDEGVFNIEGGCYAKTIRLSPTGEPQIWNAVRFGSVLENVVVDRRTRRPDFDDDRYTENTRAAYPVEFIDNFLPGSRGGHPANILFLTCDAFGVLPPLSRLTPEQALYHFLLGYTAKVAGTETGVTTPQMTFSTCFAAPFLPLHPSRYARMLQVKLEQHRAQVWLVNTGWTGGPQGLGQRMPLVHTRSMLRAILSGTLKDVRDVPEPVFGLPVPVSCPGVPDKLLQPRQTWPDAAAYDARARQLADSFRTNFAPYAAGVSEAVRKAGPTA
jgi:phosphoenolpyruvate carboxykinase (ATP)